MPVQQILWRKYVYTSALLQARRFCTKHRYFTVMVAEPQPTGLTKPQMYSKCVREVLSGKLKIKGPFKTEFKWSDHLVNGAKIIKNGQQCGSMCRAG